MNINRLKKQLTRDEKRSLKLYKCPAGKLTIGVGRNIEDRGISADEASLMLENDIFNISNELERSLFVKFRFNLYHLSDIRAEVVMNMAFQMGVPRLMNFKKTFGYIKEGNFKSASVEMLDSSWYRQMHEYDMRDGTDSVNRAERLSYAMLHDKFIE